MVGFRVWSFRVISSFLCGFYVVSGSANAPLGPISYGEIGTKLVNSYGLLAPDGDLKFNYDKNGIPQLSVQEQRKLVFNILDHRKQPFDADKEYWYQAIRSLLDDLEIFYANGQKDNDKHLFSKINYTSSVIGEAVLAKNLSMPTTDKRLLVRRQKLIKSLVDDQQFFDQAQMLINDIKKTEPALLSFWVGDESSIKALIDSHYFKDKSWNKDPRKLELWARAKYLWTLEPLFRDVLYSALILHVSNKLIAPITGNSSAYMGTPLDSLRDSFFGIVPIQNMHRLYALQTGSMNSIEYSDSEKYLVDLEKRNNPAWATSSQALSAAKWDAFTRTVGKLYLLMGRIDGIKSTIAYAAHVRKTFNQMQTKLIDIATFVDDIKKIETLAQEREELQGLATFDVAHFMKNKSFNNKEFVELLNLLETPTFHGTASFLSYTGRILKAYALMQKQKAEFASLMELYGELDACLSCAKLVKTYANKRVGYCFVEYAENADPYINLKDFWNPQVNSDLVVVNDLVLGLPEKARNIVLTGSNTGGKSTLLKAISFDILLAQTFGIAAAKSMTLTLFAYIGTTMNIVDNAAQGKSLYQAEVDRAAALMKAAKKMYQLGLPCFIIIDELFRGTGPEKADKETYEFAQKLTTLDNTSFILATHFIKKPTTLEAETKGVVKNCKVEAYITKQGKIRRTFKLEPGINRHNIAEDLLKKALEE